MLYFAMIGGERRGPYRLDELSDAGVRPGTYVWCKGMADWEKAEDVADICRYFRGRIFDMMHGGSPTPVAKESAPQGDPYDAVPPRFREFARRAGISPSEFKEINGPDTSRRPMPTVFLALFVTLFCSPISGLVAVYFSFMANKKWNESERTDPAKELYTPQERENLRLKAHDYSRRAKMWIGITFFIGIIAYALVSLHLV